MNVLLLAGVSLVGFLFYSKAKASDGVITVNDVFTNHKYNLKDIEPDNQKGAFSRSFDYELKAASLKTGVPFALIKAHALTESSLRPNAKRAEGIEKKSGQMRHSYGLMQVMWWPMSQRFKKWGYADETLRNGEKLFDVNCNTHLGALFIQDGLDRLKNLDDAINCYNTGKRVSEYPAPHDYVKKVKNYYSQILGEVV